ncbi:MAG: hypothetical protein H6556_19795 [Lewinellaceae bacterium]|nr:hypothetical protein [Lewinellaceae bacterium]
MGSPNSKVKDAGMAFSLLFLLAGLWGGYAWAYYVAAAALLVNMAWPPFFTPFAYVWYKLSEVLGSFSSRVILSAAFFLAVTPVALVRKLLGKDSLRLRDFKKGRESAFITRGHTFDGEGMERPF